MQRNRAFAILVSFFIQVPWKFVMVKSLVKLSMEYHPRFDLPWRQTLRGGSRERLCSDIYPTLIVPRFSVKRQKNQKLISLRAVEKILCSCLAVS
jgi:hypothetical protein